MDGFLFSLLKPVAAKGIGKLWDNRKSFFLYFKTNFLKYRKMDIRFSISYLFRIRIPDTNSYLLVFNRRIANQLQPPGGAYKRYGDNTLFEKWGYKPDHKQNGLGTDQKSESDLRFKVKGNHVIDVIKWFEEGKEREISGEREFIEELLDTNILDKEIFRKLNYKHIKRQSKNLKWSEHHQCYEVLLYDIFELIPTSTQSEYLKKLSTKRSANKKDFLIVEFEEIQQLRVMNNSIQIAKIGQHTKLIINEDFN